MLCHPTHRDRGPDAARTEPGRKERHPAHTATHPPDELSNAGIDTASIAFWLGHATIHTTQSHRHADLELKRRTAKDLDRYQRVRQAKRR
ncbi:hypothetical protein GCM10022251_30380 [Phytohabitans flavus]|uniref:Uncharacterized protein n=1 Tax=Phytohabitans flavus TaxID=1076124 RepID=A0A6F8XX53_9ACTN|nr:hypothetical protein Pflav_047890 [Phytohabitans flavus]